MICIVGAGAAGLAAGNRLKEKGIPFEIIEKASDVGGLWDYRSEDSPVYESTRLISSKRQTEFSHFPLPQEYEDYPDHKKVLAYFKAFAKEKGLYPHIRFNTKVTSADRQPDGRWSVQFEGAERVYSHLILGSGFASIPSFPKIVGEFHGESLHSKFYKTPDIFAGKRVLIIGAGNSGCDIATEAAKTAQTTYISMRRGYYFIPRYFMGIPSDELGELLIKLKVPMKVRQAMNQLLVRLALGQPEKYGFRKPDHRILESHPIVNSDIVRLAAQGKVNPVGDIISFAGNRVFFKNASEEKTQVLDSREVDLILFATGYLPEIPFLDKKHLNWREDRGHPEFYLHVFHPEYDNLFITGMVQPDSGTWGIFDAQAESIASFISAQQSAPEFTKQVSPIKSDLSEDQAQRCNYLPSLRHHCEVEHSSYVRRLTVFKDLIESLSAHRAESREVAFAE